MHRLSIGLGGILALVCAPASFGVPVITNGDFTGPAVSSTAPPGWFSWQQTPDTCNASEPFNNTGVLWTLSPNGGTFVRAGGVDYEGGSEAIGQNVSGFTPGVAYTLDFFQSNLGFYFSNFSDWIGSDGYWQLRIDGVTVGNSATISKPSTFTDPIVWSPGSITFVATSATHEIALLAKSDVTLASYMAIDGVSIREVPAPGAAGVLALALFVPRRRR